MSKGYYSVQIAIFFVPMTFQNKTLNKEWSQKWTDRDNLDSENDIESIGMMKNGQILIPSECQINTHKVIYIYTLH